ncbi:unnamed protein product, partial [Ixodes persulcatus]
MIRRIARCHGGTQRLPVPPVPRPVDSQQAWRAQPATPPKAGFNPWRLLRPATLYGPKLLKVLQSTLHLPASATPRAMKQAVDASPASPESTAGAATTSSSRDPGVMRRNPSRPRWSLPTTPRCRRPTGTLGAPLHRSVRR